MNFGFAFQNNETPMVFLGRMRKQFWIALPVEGKDGHTANACTTKLKHTNKNN